MLLVSNQRPTNLKKIKFGWNKVKALQWSDEYEKIERESLLKQM